MNRGTLVSIPITLIVVVAFTLILIPTKMAYATTITVTGWLMPDAAHFDNSLLATIFPLVGLVFMVTLAKMFKVNGDVGVYLALIGLLLGSLLADLPTGTIATNGITFAQIFVCALLLVLWWWNS